MEFYLQQAILLMCAALAFRSVADEIATFAGPTDALTRPALTINDECADTDIEDGPGHCTLSVLQQRAQTSATNETAVHKDMHASQDEEWLGEIQLTTAEAAEGRGGCFYYGCETRFNRAYHCQCNSKCRKHGNCCGDYFSYCVKTHEHRCSGPRMVTLRGFGCVELVNAHWNIPGELAGPVHVHEGEVIPHLTGRTYFSTNWSDGLYRIGAYNPREYLALRLLGKRFSYITDTSNAGCGCNAALYFTSMSREQNKTACEDFYCDAASVCGASCAEIDIQEANMFAYRATLHSDGDVTGWSAGSGGYGPHDRVWTNGEYGPDGKCIKTTKPYRVAAEFPIGPDGNLKELKVSLHQAGSKCDISLSVSGYKHSGELTYWLKAGMTPIISYWKSKPPFYLSWMDGWWMNGSKKLGGDGPCEVADESKNCGASVKFYDFRLEDIS
eukprot:TRINITY_DN27474_c0_g2_i1.p1 TRINITY_DN27474_c0_g2~~TRINITY_DN27474_c0_g2_i1.p1  ORF type:complete len:442 (+),score=75.87 TRINITY_DN27474_c0_g2_i1:62-1387(+)